MTLLSLALAVPVALVACFHQWMPSSSALTHWWRGLPDGTAFALATALTCALLVASWVTFAMAVVK